MLIRILNHASFELKYLKGSESCQQVLDDLVANQELGHDKIKLQVTRPTQEELNLHIAKLAPHPPPGQVQGGGGGGGLQAEGIDHLGHTYLPNKTVRLKTQSLSIVYMLNGKNRKSVDFHSFQDFLTFNRTANPIFTKRSLFSCLARNCCISGSFLVIFKAQLKVVIRTFIRKNRSVSWDSPLDPETSRKLVMCIETYFILVGKTINQPISFKYQANEMFLLGLSDGSESLQTFCITLLNRYCLDGIVSSQATHISLQAYTTHCDLVNIVDIEYLSFNKMIQAMQVVLSELENINISIPDQNRLAFLDSRVVITLLRSRVDLLKKRQSHLTAKAQICLSDMKMSPFSSVGFISQEIGNHIPDHFSKFTFQNNSQEILTKYKKLFDYSWMCSAHPRKLEGVTFNNIYQSSEAPALKNAVLDSEWQEYSSNCTNTNTDKNTDILLTAAVRVRDSIHKQCTTQPPDAPPHSINPNFHHASLGLGGESESELVTRNWNLDDEVNQSDEDYEWNRKIEQDYEMDQYDSKNISTKGGGGQSEIQTERGGDHCDTSLWKLSENELLRKDPYGDHCDKSLLEMSETQNHLYCDQESDRMSENAPRVQFAFNARKEPSICIAESKRGWKEQIEQLLQRKLSLTLGPGSILRILTLCIKFGRRALEEAKKGPADRAQRQRLRGERRQGLEEVRDREDRPTQLLRDRHDWPAQALDLMKSDLGRFEECLLESKSTRKPPADVAAFHHLCCLYSCNTSVKGLQYAQYHHLNGEPMKLLEARRQRQYSEKVIKLPRFRHIDPGSSWAKLLIKAAHNFVKGRHIERAQLGLTNLSIYMVNISEALLAIQKECTTCRRLRGRLARATDAIKLTNLGPCDYLARAAAWRTGQTTVILDLLGPLQAWSSMADDLQTTIYAAVFLQLPLKTVKILPVQSYSSADLLQTIKIYINQSFRPVQLWVSDAGSNITRFTTHNSGYEETPVMAEGKLKAWQDLATGERGKELRNSGVHIRVCSKNHKVVSSVEQAVYSTKKVIYAFDKGLKTPLSMWDWLFIFSEVEASIKSRPLCATSKGRLYSAGSILSALEQAGLHLGDDQLYVHPGGDAEVTAQLDAMTNHLLELRQQIGELLLSLLIQPSFLNTQVRREQLKFRDIDQDIQRDDVCFDPALFRKTNNVTASLVRLHKWSTSRQSALFQKVGPLKPSSYITRPIDQLFLVAKSDRDTSFGTEEWKPVWNLSDLYKAQPQVKPYLVWDQQNDELELKGDLDVSKDLGNLGPKRPGETKKRDQKTSDQGAGGPEENVQEAQVFTKRGRLVKRPTRFQP